MSDLSISRYVEYAHNPPNSWTSVERPVFDYLFSRFYKDRFNGMASAGRVSMITTSFGSRIPTDFSVLDLGSATGRVPARLIEYGVLPQNIIGLDKNQTLLDDAHFPEGVRKLNARAETLDHALRKQFPGREVKFNLVTSNMLFHLMSYQDMVSSLKQARGHMFTQQGSLLMMVIPHPYREMLVNSIDEYHSQSVAVEKTPWNDSAQYHFKTIQDYERAIADAGFHCFYVGTTGVGLEVHDRYLLSDNAVWMKIKSGDKSVPHAFRYWFIAEPDSFLPEYYGMRQLRNSTNRNTI